MSAVPVIYYHSVADHDVRRDWDFLSISIDAFEKQMEWLARAGWKGVHYGDLIEHLAGRKELPEKSFMLQFDDGFLDNWTVAHPILKRFEIKYVVVISRDFIDSSLTARPSLRRTRGVDPREWWGYLNRAEMREMIGSGLCEFQAHAGTHTWYETGPEVLGRFGDLKHKINLPWLYWNENPTEKPTWLTKDWRRLVDDQRVVFKHAKSLEARRFFPSADYLELLAQGKSMASALGALGGAADRLGSYESDAERESRLLGELSGIKDWIEQELGTSVVGIVWPGGGQNPLTARLARQVGYKVLSKGAELNGFGSQSDVISRLSGTISWKGRPLNHGQQAFLKLQLFRGQSAALHRFANRLKRWVR